MHVEFAGQSGGGCVSLSFFFSAAVIKYLAGRNVQQKGMGVGYGPDAFSVWKLKKFFMTLKDKRVVGLPQKNEIWIFKRGNPIHLHRLRCWFVSLVTDHPEIIHFLVPHKSTIVTGRVALSQTCVCVCMVNLYADKKGGFQGSNKIGKDSHPPSKTWPIFAPFVSEEFF